jgi:hypothetical protein
MKIRGGEAMNSIVIVLVWLAVAFVIGVVFGKFCAVGSGLDAQILEKFSMESDTLMDNLIPIDDSVEEVA